MIAAPGLECKFEIQGSLFVARAPGHQAAVSVFPALRSTITSFSAASRRRLIRLTARISPDWQGTALFASFTYPPEVSVCPKCAKADLRSWVRRLERYGQAKGFRVPLIWRLEAQKNGNPHFHVLAFVPFIAMETLKEWWAEIVSRGDDRAKARSYSHGMNISSVRQLGRVRSYVSKTLAYCAKEGEAPKCSREGCCCRCGLDYASYWDAPGRWWGVVGREYLPFGAKLLLKAGMGSWYWSLRRAARRYWSGVGYRNNRSFCLYTSDVGSWLKLALYFAAKKDLTLAVIYDNLEIEQGIEV